MLSDPRYPRKSAANLIPETLNYSPQVGWVRLNQLPELSLNTASIP